MVMEENLPLKMESYIIEPLETEKEEMNQWR